MRPQPLAIGSLVVGVACAGLSLGGDFGDRYSWCIRQNPCISNESWRKPDPEIKAQLMPGIGITRTIAGVVGAIAMGGAFLAGGAAAIAEEKRLVLEAAAKEETKQLAITQAAVLLEEEKQKLAIASELRIDAFGNEQLNAHAKLFLLENPEVIERFTAPPAPSAPPALPAPLSPKPEQQPEPHQEPLSNNLSREPTVQAPPETPKAVLAKLIAEHEGGWLLCQLDETDFINSSSAGYRWSEHKSNYGGVRQRWLVVESSVRRDSDLRSLEKNITKADLEGQKKLRELSRIEFACETDAIVAANRLNKPLEYHSLTQIKIIKVTAKRSCSVANYNQRINQVFKIQAQLESDPGLIAQHQRACGRFILATNVMDSNQLTAEQMIAKYQEQQACERGFGFLKEPQFFTDSWFLKSPERIEALALVIGLCLLVYTNGQRYLRRSL